jgi:preprotein translocase subunit SecD
MRRISSMVGFAVFLCVGIVDAQSSRLSIRAASVEPVEGWQAMQVEHCQGQRCTVWVSPTAALTESDIEQAQAEVRDDGYRVINVVFTDAGVNKLHDLTAAQFKKTMALVVDGKVLWAPMVQYIAGAPAKNNVLTGATPTGLTQEEVDLIMSILRSSR